MRPSDLLAATGNVWEVRCYRDGNRRQLQSVRYIRAGGILTAENIARQVSHCRIVDARPWNPLTDRSVHGFVRRVAGPDGVVRTFQQQEQQS